MIAAFATVALASALQNALAPGLRNADDYSLTVLGADGGTIFARRADRALAPASTLKLIVAAAALGDLGADYRFRTLVAARAPLAADGTLTGDLWLEGSGDPSLVREDLDHAADALYAAGVRRIAGSVVGDGAADAPPETNALWNPADANEGFQAPTSGLSLDEDTVEFRVYGGAPGSAARVAVVPASDAVRYTNLARTGGWDDGEIDVVPAGSRNGFVVSGRVAPYGEQKVWVPIHGVPRYVASVFTRMLRDRGIAVAGAPRTGRTPLDTRVLWMHRSAPLRALVGWMLVHSDNHYAEQLMRRLGGIAGAPSDAGGLAAERAFLHRRAIPTPGLHLVDGSGLAHADRAASVTFAAILADAERRGGDADLRTLLPLGGEQGTLKHYRFVTAAGRVRAKSGHLDGVDSLAGYVTTRTKGRVIFAFIMVGVTRDADTALVQAVDALAAM